MAPTSIVHTVGDTVYTFKKKAIEKIKDANAASDAIARLNGGFWDDSVHFDSEKFIKATDRLMLLKDQIIEELQGCTPNGDRAQELLGEAHHTLQDFYAHSNWVELVGWNFRNGFNDDLGREPIFASEFGNFCPDDPDTLARIDGLTSGYFELGLASFAVPPQFIPSKVLLDVCFNYPDGKCRHGVDFKGVALCAGINKDTPDNEGHRLAKALAVASTIDFTLNLILKDDAIKDNEDAVAALTGTEISKSLSFVIDDTVSHHFTRDLRFFKRSSLLTISILFSRDQWETILMPLSPR